MAKLFLTPHVSRHDMWNKVYAHAGIAKQTNKMTGWKKAPRGKCEVCEGDCMVGHPIMRPASHVASQRDRETYPPYHC